ncbi:MAG: pectate lyase, partial [Hymenobacter sp.]
MARLPLGKDGLRGAVLLEKGTHEVAGQLFIRASGVVLRGSGPGAGGTVLLGTGFMRANLLTISGRADRKTDAAQAITADYVPVNARTVRVANAAAFKVGDRVVVSRPSTAAWIKTLGMETFGGGLSALGWKAGQRDIHWDRQVVAIDANGLTLDAPLTTALDKAYGGGTVARVSWPGLISQVGVENLQLESTTDAENPKDENHRWVAIDLENAQDAWVRQVAFRHFAGSAVLAHATVRRLTVEDCRSTEPVSEIGNERRNTFYTLGSQTLFQRLYTENGYHDFAVGYCAAGPNAFVQCEAEQAL